MNDSTMDSVQFGTVGTMRNPSFGQQQMVGMLLLQINIKRFIYLEAESLYNNTNNYWNVLDECIGLKG